MKKEGDKKPTGNKVGRNNLAAKKPAIIRQMHKIDATDQAMGRLATKISIILRGKNKPDFQPNIDSGDFIMVKNATKMKFTGNKLSQKIYYHHSGFPGGLKEKKISEIFDKNSAEVLKRAIWNMLPKNKLRKNMFKRLKISN